MQLVEQHIININDHRFKLIDKTSFLSKNLYNAATYVMREALFSGNLCPSYYHLYQIFKNNTDYKMLPRKVSQQVLMQVDKAWKLYFTLRNTYKVSPEKLTGEPKIPGYKDKIKGRNVLIYTIQAINKKQLRLGLIKLSGLDIVVKTTKNKDDICQVRIVPHKTHYTVEVIYNKEPIIEKNLDSELYAGLDIGVNNIATIASNKNGFVPIVVNGRHIKSINQYYNKRKAFLQSKLIEATSSKKIDKLSNKRNKKINHELHICSKKIIDHLVVNNIGNLIIGKNYFWKQKNNNGKQNNQNFLFIPHARFINMLIYKAKLVGIKVTTIEESYTSKCSFLDLESLEKHDVYVGHRRYRGLFISANKKKINADVNAAYNIIRKVVPDTFKLEGIEGVVVHPVHIL